MSAQEDILNAIQQMWHQEKVRIREKLAGLKKEEEFQERFAQSWFKRTGVLRKTKRKIAIEEEREELLRRLGHLEQGRALPQHIQEALKTLGVSDILDTKTVKSAYRAKAKVTHPDMGGRTEEMVAVNNAFNIISSWIGERKGA